MVRKSAGWLWLVLLLAVPGLLSGAENASSQPGESAVPETVARPAPKVLTPVTGWAADSDAYEQRWGLKGELALTLPIKQTAQIFGCTRPSPLLVIADRDKALNAEDLLVLKPGAKVSLDVSLCASDEAARTQVVESLTRKLKARGIIIADGQPIGIVASCQVASSRTEKYGKGFFGQSNPQDVTVNTYENKLTVLEDGKPIWQVASQAGGGIPSVLNLAKGQSIQDAANKSQGDPSSGYFQSVFIPGCLAKGSVDGFGYSQITPKGPIDIPRPVPLPR